MVLSPSATGRTGAKWLDSFIKAGGLHTFDIAAFHGYDGVQAERITATVDAYRLVLSRHNLSATALWDTECSWGADNIGDDAHRAAFLSKFFVLQWSKSVDRVLWYAYDGDPKWGRLIDTENNLSPAGVAYRETYKWIVGATLTQPCAQDHNGTWTCSLTRPGGYTAQIVWNSTAATSLSFSPPSQMTQYRDLSGGVHPIVGGTVPGTEPSHSARDRTYTNTLDGPRDHRSFIAIIVGPLTFESPKNQILATNPSSPSPPAIHLSAILLMPEPDPIPLPPANTRHHPNPPHPRTPPPCSTSTQPPMPPTPGANSSSTSRPSSSAFSSPSPSSRQSNTSITAISSMSWRRRCKKAAKLIRIHQRQHHNGPERHGLGNGAGCGLEHTGPTGSFTLRRMPAAELYAPDTGVWLAAKANGQAGLLSAANRIGSRIWTFWRARYMSPTPARSVNSRMRMPLWISPSSVMQPRLLPANSTSPRSIRPNAPPSSSASVPSPNKPAGSCRIW